MGKKKKTGFIPGDPALIPRVRTYVESLSTPPPTYVAVDEVDAHLRHTFSRVYARQAKAPFRALVLRALDTVMRDIHPPVPLPAASPTTTVPSPSPSSAPPSSSARPPPSASPLPTPPANALASSMTSMYKDSGKKRKRRRKAVAGSGGGGNTDGSSSGDGGDDGVAKKRAKGLGGDGTEDEGAGGAKDSFVVAPVGSFDDVGGLDEAVVELRLALATAIRHPEVYAAIGTGPTRGILLHGPPGTGKTLLANALAAELNVPFLRISAPEIVTSFSGDSEAKLRSLFDAAVIHAPCIVFMDEIDSIAPARASSSRDMERRIVAQLLTCLDDLTMEKTGGKPVVVIAATNRPHALDPALRRGGRFDREIALGIPNEASRRSILAVTTRSLTLAPDVDLDALAAATPGYVGADLVTLCKEAASLAIKRAFETLFLAAPPPTAPGASPAPAVEDGRIRVVDAKAQAAAERTARNKALVEALEARSDPLGDDELAGVAIAQADFDAAVSLVQPSAKREGFATVPDVSWDDVGALGDVRQQLNDAIVNPIKFPQLHERMGLSQPAGVLLYGPPGCGKTLLAKAIASSSNASFISIKGPELLNKYVGESERAVRQVFQRGRASAPCVIFFDELDALCPARDGESNASGKRLVNQLLTEMDGLSARGQVYIIGATNRPDIIDDAIMRPGRLEKLVYVPLPQPADRVAILATLARSTPLHADVDLTAIALDPRADGFSGADLAALVRQSATLALRECLDSMPPDSASSTLPSHTYDLVSVAPRHFDAAFAFVLPSVSSTTASRYDSLSLRSRHRPAPTAPPPAPPAPPPPEPEYA